MKFVFLRAYDFPLGGAPQNRLLGICRGLNENGHTTEVHQYAPSKLNFKENHRKSQIYNDVRILNHAWRWSPARNKIRQLTGLFFGIWLTFFAVLKSNRKEKIQFLFVNSTKTYTLIIFWFASKLIGARLGRDLNEYPDYILSPAKYNKLSKWYKIQTNYKWFDVIFFISHNLTEYYKPMLKKSAKSLLLPMTVDMNRFPKAATNHTEAKFITYCGDLSQSKDGVFTLLHAFSIIIREFPELVLKLVGKNNDAKHMNSLHNLLTTLGIEKQTILTGFLPSDQIPGELYNSRLLVLSRPANIQSQGGFPTKLGEYLATAVPVVLANVGEISIYLQDEVNAYIAEPDHPELFANAMLKALRNPEQAKRVGIAGRTAAMQHFSHHSQGKLISDFVNSL